MSTTFKLILAFTVSMLFFSLAPSLRRSDAIREELFLPYSLVVGAYLAAGRSKSLWPFALYGALSVAYQIFSHWNVPTPAAGTGALAAACVYLISWTPRAVIVISLCCGAAWLRQRLDQGRAEPSPFCCGNCGYSLVGLTEARCPECGAPFSKSLLPELKDQADAPDIQRQKP